jgi:hypothetical protein
MLTKWQRRKPNKFTDYITSPSRYDLAELLRGNYNACWDYQRVAEGVAGVYRNAERHLRAEMITAQLIAHRRTRMLSGFDGLDMSALVSDLLATIARSGVEPKGNTHHFRYNWAEGRAEPVWSA